MQVKKFEAPTMNEALQIIKNELGPEAIILSTKNHRKGFGLLSKASVEVTAAISEKALGKKKVTERIIPESKKQEIEKLPASAQAKIFNNFGGYVEKRYKEQKKKQEKPQLQGRRYVDIGDEDSNDEVAVPKNFDGANPAAYARNGRVNAQADYQDKKPIYSTPVAAPSYGMANTAAPQLQQQLQPAIKADASEVELEVKKLKMLVEELKSEQSAILDARAVENTIELNAEFQSLLRNGIDKKYASGIIKQIGFQLSHDELQSQERVLDQLAMEIMSEIKVTDPLEDVLSQHTAQKKRSILALVGPTGVGKTTTIAKLASLAILQKNLKVGLINIDDYKVAATDQLATYAKILNVPFRQATTPAELDRALAEFKPMDLVLIDTSGRSQRDSESLAQMKNLIESSGEIKTLLIMSATTREQELQDIVNRFKMFAPTGLVFSKLDETTTFGCIYNMAVKTKMPLTYFTVGQRVPEDIESASRERLASLILDI